MHAKNSAFNFMSFALFAELQPKYHIEGVKTYHSLQHQNIRTLSSTEKAVHAKNLACNFTFSAYFELI